MIPYKKSIPLLLILLSLSLNLFLALHWTFSIRELWPTHYLYPWMLIDDIGGRQYNTIVNPLVYIACVITFVSSLILMVSAGWKKGIGLFAILALIFQLVFVFVLSQMERPSFMG
jgi:hypothetical protein